MCADFEIRVTETVNNKRQQMAETRRHSLGNQLDIEQILLEAEHRWLRPAEICEILQNYKKFGIAPEPPKIPPSGSLFLFDRKVLRYFRKDGHNWRKKKDGKTVKEAHERLKAGSIDVLHCYYAHGEENENFQRRSYWMLEEELSHIVFVHYLEVKGTRTNFNRIQDTNKASLYCQETKELMPISEIDSSRSTTSCRNNDHGPSLTTDMASQNSVQASEYEDAESAYNHQGTSRFHSFLEVQQPGLEKIGAELSDCYIPASSSGNLSNSGLDFLSLAQVDKVEDSHAAGLAYGSRKNIDFSSWDDALHNCNLATESLSFQQSATESHTVDAFHKPKSQISGQHWARNFGESWELDNRPQLQDGWQVSESDGLHLSKAPVDHSLQLQSAYDGTPSLHEEQVNNVNLIDSPELCDTPSDNQRGYCMHDDLQMQHLNSQSELLQSSVLQSNATLEGESNHSSSLEHHVLVGSETEVLKKLDSFNRWMSKELGDVNESHTQASSGMYWDTLEGENAIDDTSIAPQACLETDMLSPSVSQDQLFSIIDFSPNWAYVGSKVKVLITGRFLKGQLEIQNYKWSCMFGEMEVPLEIVAEGVFRCHSPLHGAGRVPFYVTSSNRLACSEVREFEYRVDHIPDVNTADNCGNRTIDNLSIRFGKLLCLSCFCPPKFDSSCIGKMPQFNQSLLALKEDNDEWSQMLKLTSEGFPLEEVKNQLLQKLLKDRLHVWLVQKVVEGGKGPCVLDEDGQGALHFSAALGYDWALEPIIVAGVNVNFRDVNGWTALHWAALYGREHTVAFLISKGAAPGALTDPTPKYPAGRTPADLASASGHKGIAGYLAESALSTHLSSLNLGVQHGNAAEHSGTTAVQTVSERSATPVSDGDLQYGLSLKDSLAAVRNATQAAARIHQVFRVQSFQKKQLKEYSDNKFGMPDEQALSCLVVKTQKRGQQDEPVHMAAVRIQNKFRSWKGRKEFLVIRERIVKIQAHVRGHQVRKNYRKIIWSVGIMEKIILRWRRKGSGLRGFKQESLTEGTGKRDSSSKEDDSDFLKEGRKQTEERLQKALARVKSMVQYPEARDQYRRLLNVFADIQETKVEEATDFDDNLIDLDALPGDDTVMSTAS
ncbi:calmodulin-binding transcription activator 3 isoform X2 [Tripterygium wilfordii]|uniref:calmodulin-binding transcription activator 3 isoform X2 n=1 Tax=Tripterygium wilfordii TaxID=458696 RepID=UPI0018F81A10|nr:calmodulin-binding transcription activator 3 isoform X2 [Tripterygium wilfordii]